MRRNRHTEVTVGELLQKASMRGGFMPRCDKRWMAPSAWLYSPAMTLDKIVALMNCRLAALTMSEFGI